MTTAITVHDEERIGHLAEEIQSILSVAYEASARCMIAAKYMVGEAVATNALYRKYAKTQGTLYGEIFKQTSVRVETLADCVKLYETHPRKNPKQLADKLYIEHGSWRNVRLALYGGDSNAVRKVERSECRHCKLVEEMLKRIRRFDHKEKGVDYFAGWDHAIDTVLIDLKNLHKKEDQIKLKDADDVQI